jgi:RNA polymerase sigma factor (sigma-70 family)
LTLSSDVTAIGEVDQRAAFSSFVAEAEPQLRRALCALRGRAEGREATAEALAWAWEHWPKLRIMENPVGYLYRVGRSRSRPRLQQRAFATAPPDPQRFEPGLIAALDGLSPRQREAVVLVHGCGWTHQEVADALGLSRSSVGTHVERGMDRLRTALGATDG